jgi:anti-sigma factor RsiW
MSCQEIENKILDYRENQLQPAERRAVEGHLAGCARCRAFDQDLQELDAALSRGIKLPAFSPDFDGRLRERIQAAPPMLSETERAERKRQLQAEFDAGMVRLARAEFALHRLLNHLVRPLLLALAGCLVWRLTPPLMVLLGVSGLSDRGRNLLSWMLMSAVFLAVGLAEAYPQRWKGFRLRKGAPWEGKSATAPATRH